MNNYTGIFTHKFSSTSIPTKQFILESKEFILSIIKFQLLQLRSSIFISNSINTFLVRF